MQQSSGSVENKKKDVFYFINIAKNQGMKLKEGKEL